MRAYTFQPAGEAYQLDLVDRPLPEPGAGELRVRVEAASLNYRDLIALRNLFGRKVAGRVPLSDGAGTITAIGSGVSGWQVGDRVAGIFFQTWTDGRFDLSHHKSDLGGNLDGMLAEEVILRSEGIVRIPEHLSFEEAACLPCAAVTAWQSLVTRGGLQAGESVLVLGTGGVSIFALQFAIAMGARVIATSSSEEKLQRAKSLGASDGVNYRTDHEWSKEVWKLTGGQGVDHIIEVGGPGTLGQSLGSVAGNGNIYLIGVLTGFGPPSESLFPALARNATLHGIYVGSRADFEAMNAFLAEHRLKPIIDEIYPFEEATQAFEHLESGRHFGKIVIKVRG